MSSALNKTMGPTNYTNLTGMECTDVPPNYQRALCVNANGQNLEGLIDIYFNKEYFQSINTFLGEKRTDLSKAATTIRIN